MGKDFKFVVDSIFINRQNYDEITDEDKINSFFKINQKFALKYPKVAQLFNNKFVDKASAIDRWYLAFEKSTMIPDWYWKTKKQETKKAGNLTKKQINFLIQEFELKESDINFLHKFYKSDLDEILKTNKHKIE